MVKAITSKAEFDTLINSGDVIVVDYWATWCGPCRVVSPVFEKLEADNSNLKFIKVDIDEAPEIAASEKIKAMPTFKAYKDGKVIEEFVGAVPAKLHSLIAAASAQA